MRQPGFVRGAFDELNSGRAGLLSARHRGHQHDRRCRDRQSEHRDLPHAFTLPAKITSSSASFQVTGGSGTACTGSVCGFSVAIYDKAKALVGATETGTSRPRFSGKNINDSSFNGGVKTLNWSSGSGVSGGKLTLDLAVTGSATRPTARRYRFWFGTTRPGCQWPTGPRKPLWISTATGPG